MPEEIKVKVENFFSNYALRKYTKGQILLLAGDRSEYVYYLVSGQVRVYDVTYRGEEIVLNIFKPPAFFPMSQAINPSSENPYIYEADTAVELRIAPNQEIVEFIQANPDVTYNLLSRLYIGVDGLLGRMSYLMSASALTRLIYELIINAQRFGQKHEDGSCTLDVSEKSLGSRAGLSRETVSREMKKLKSEGLIEIKSKTILINDLAALQEKLGHAV